MEKRVLFKSTWLPWALVAPQMLIVLVFFFLEETGFHRGDDLTPNVEFPRSFIPNRVATFLPGTKVVPHISLSQLVSIFPTAFKNGSLTLLVAGETIHWSIRYWHRARRSDIGAVRIHRLWLHNYAFNSTHHLPPNPNIIRRIRIQYHPERRL